MSDHTTALVPLESWCYNSPELRASGKSIDVGLLVEALIYYDCVIVNVGNQPQFAELLNWFIAQKKYSDFLALINDGVIKIYDYAFSTNAILKDGVYSIWNIQDSIQAQPNTFDQRFLYHKDIQTCLNHTRQREKLYKALRDKVIEVKADEFGSAIENARRDYDDANRNALIIQAFVDELYKIKNLGSLPEVRASVTASPDGGRKHVTWNVDFDHLSYIAGKELNFHRGTPLTAGAISNRLLWSAASLECDLYLGQPISVLVGDKLYESSKQISKVHSVIEELQQKVEFPDVRQLVNSGKIGLKEILMVRKRLENFVNGYNKNLIETGMQ